MMLIMSHGFHAWDSVERMIWFMGFDWLIVYCDMTHVSHLRYLELSTGLGGPLQTQPMAVFPAPPDSTGWGGVLFGIPCHYCRSGRPPTHTPDGSQKRIGGNKSGPVHGMSLGGP